MSDKVYVDAVVTMLVPATVKVSLILRDPEGDPDERVKAFFRNEAQPGEVEVFEVAEIKVFDEELTDDNLFFGVQESLEGGETAVTVVSTEVTDAK